MAAKRPENAEEQLVAEALQRAFGGPVPPAAFLAGREAVQAAAALAAEEAAADADLVAAALTGAFAAPVDAEVKAEHAAAIRAAAQTDNVIPLRRIGHRVGRHAVAAMVAVSTMAGGSGVAAASSDALPGQVLYPVKRAVEQVMLTAAWTPVSEARVQATLAARRLVEVELLLASGASPHLVEPLLNEYDRHVAAVEELSVSDASVEVAELEEKADALREQAVTVTTVDEPPGDGAVTMGEPTESSTAAATTTEPATAGPSESTSSGAEQGAAPAPAPSATSSPKPTSDSTPAPSGTTSDTSAGSTPPSTQPTPTTSPSPSTSPKPSASPTPKSPNTEADDSKSSPGEQSKPKPNKPEPTPEATPTANPERTPLSDSETADEAGPLADWEEQSYTDGS